MMTNIVTSMMTKMVTNMVTKMVTNIVTKMVTNMMTNIVTNMMTNMVTNMMTNMITNTMANIGALFCTETAKYMDGDGNNDDDIDNHDENIADYKYCNNANSTPVLCSQGKVGPGQASGSC